MERMSFLPITKEDMKERGWDQLDFLFISGDAYVDHPSFGHAIITRVLESEGFRVGIIPQPDWRKSEDFLKLGTPRLGILISSGVIDSMVNHYTASKKKRSDDLYSPGGKSGHRPDRAVIAYANKARQLFKDLPVIIGGIEASLRRFAHYDYWDDKVRRSILQDSGADLLIYGMGEKPIVEIAALLDKGVPIWKIKGIRGTAYITGMEGMPKGLSEALISQQSTGDRHESYIDGSADLLPEFSSSMKSKKYKSQPNRDSASKSIEFLLMPSFESVLHDKKAYAIAHKLQQGEQDSVHGRILVQQHGDQFVVQNPPQPPMSVSAMDKVYALPYERTYHPIYEKEGGIPAIREVEFSITSHRGCYGGCSFCALNFHQGRVIQHRSQASILNEARNMTWHQDFKGYIHDVGGPTANFRHIACKKQVEEGVCKNRQCLHPSPCKNLIVDHSEYLDLLRKLRELPRVKKVFIRSGIRYDYLMLDKNDAFFKELCRHHISDQLKVAPEHVSDKVLSYMGKPGKKVYEGFVRKYEEINDDIQKEQYLVPYLISSHPGSDLNAAIEMAEYLRDMKYSPEQVQDFYPTPATLSTCMFYTGIDPRTMKAVFVPKDPKEKAMQRALLQYRKPSNRPLVMEALKKAGREDLIGFGPKCLIRPFISENRKKESDGTGNGFSQKKPSIRGRTRSKSAPQNSKKATTTGNRSNH